MGPLQGDHGAYFKVHGTKNNWRICRKQVLMCIISNVMNSYLTRSAARTPDTQTAAHKNKNKKKPKTTNTVSHALLFASVEQLSDIKGKTVQRCWSPALLINSPSIFNVIKVGEDFTIVRCIKGHRSQNQNAGAGFMWRRRCLGTERYSFTFSSFSIQL